ncbi:effector binding domain-containing protein [Paenibacillus sp. JDR-2]|uniref:effector binding domain-containing protein n=1 Tax=Paenibacillus sp. (strain JDR-2) TaxID=324057 RepID=UPI0002E7F414|nr:effector binding domain-containing protein [Paenibacillus sp. JDR-2]
MEHYTRIQYAITFIEEQLQEALSLEAIAIRAGFSLYHFQRLFHAITGFTVQEYIRKRRLSRAAEELRVTRHTVLDISVSYQYGSQEAFTRAFAGYFGMAPAQYRKHQPLLALRLPIDLVALTANIRGGLTMYKPDIIERPATRIIGYNYPTNLNNERYFEEIPGFYAHFGNHEYFMRIPNKARPAFAYGIPHGYGEDGAFSFLIGEEVTSFAEVEEGFACLELPSGKYAAFRNGTMPEIGQNAWKYIYGTWLPNSNYERGEGPDFEVTDVLNSTPQKISMTIYIPIR